MINTGYRRRENHVGKVDWWRRKRDRERADGKGGFLVLLDESEASELLKYITMRGLPRSKVCSSIMSIFLRSFVFYEYHFIMDARAIISYLSFGPAISTLIPFPSLTLLNASSASSNLTVPVINLLTSTFPSETNCTASL